MSNKASLIIYRADADSDCPLPYADLGIKAGFPSPAQDYMEQTIDLNKEIIKNPFSTFFGRVVGDSMVDARLYDGDIIVIDKSSNPIHGIMAVCFVDGDFTVKYLDMERHKDGIIRLVPANTNYKPIVVTSENNFMFWGRVIRIISVPPFLDK